MARYGLVGFHTRDLLTYDGQVIVHNNREELEFLFPKMKDQIVRLTDGALGAPAMRLQDHPKYVEQGISFPLKKEEFRW